MIQALWTIREHIPVTVAICSDSRMIRWTLQRMRIVMLREVLQWATRGTMRPG